MKMGWGVLRKLCFNPAINRPLLCFLFDIGCYLDIIINIKAMMDLYSVNFYKG